MKGSRKSMTVTRLKEGNGQPKSHPCPWNEETSNMVKMLSHDLRGSLVSMSATLKLLSRGYYGKMDETVENKLRELLEGMTHLIGMSEECLGKAFSLDGNFTIRQEVLDLREDIIHPVLEELSSEIRDHHLRIDNRLEHVQASRIPIRANKVWLKAIFRNLFKNAIRYGDLGGTIAFGFEIHGSSYRLNIFNSGNPIPDGWQDKLFTKVAPIRKNSNRSKDGMGLGLYLIKKLIQKLGGKIWYEAKAHGSNFVLTLPIEAR
jgi:signal transduction histidine kinase